MLVFMLILISALILFSWVRLQMKKRNAHISGWVVDSDLDGKGKFFKGPSGIIAKPDVVINLSDKKRVVERKNSVCKNNRPYKSNLLQVAAEMEAVGASEGVLIYSNKSFLVHQTPELSTALETVRSNLEKTRLRGQPPEATPTRGKCKKCDFMNECPEAAF